MNCSEIKADRVGGIRVVPEDYGPRGVKVWKL